MLRSGGRLVMAEYLVSANRRPAFGSDPISEWERGWEMTLATEADWREALTAAGFVNIEFDDFLDEDEARDILREAPGILVIDKREPGGYVTPIECVGDYATFVSRIRQDSTIENGLSMWIVSDNLRKGAALNAVQIAEELDRRLLKGALDKAS